MGKKVLLIADDDELNRRIIKRFLKDAFEVVEAVDGKQTLEVLRSTHVDLVLLDIIMPEIDGLEVLKIMKESPAMRHVGVLVATSTKEKTERTALALGADDVVSKPYDPTVIQKRLENVLDVKEIAAQRELLHSEDVDALVGAQVASLMARLEPHFTRIQKCADVILANADNHKLVVEVADEIKHEVNDVVVGLRNE